MSPDRISDNRNKFIATVLAKPLDRTKRDHLGSSIVVANLVDQIHNDPEYMEWVGGCPRNQVHVEVTSDITTPLSFKPAARKRHRFLGSSKLLNV